MKRKTDVANPEPRMKKIRAYMFVGETLVDGSPLPEEGRAIRRRTLVRGHGFPVGLHPFDALTYGYGKNLCLVDVIGGIWLCDHEVVDAEIEIIKRIDATELLLYFARMQALSALDYLGEDVPDVVIDYLKTGDESIRLAARRAYSGEAKECVKWATTLENPHDAAWIATLWSMKVFRKKIDQAASKKKARDMFARMVNKALEPVPG